MKAEEEREACCAERKAEECAAAAPPAATAGGGVWQLLQVTQVQGNTPPASSSAPTTATTPRECEGESCSHVFRYVRFRYFLPLSRHSFSPGQICELLQHAARNQHLRGPMYSKRILPMSTLAADEHHTTRKFPPPDPFPFRI